MLKWIAALLLLALVLALVVPRLAPDDAGRWHVDPATARPSDRPNSYLIADYDAVRLPLSADEAFARIDAIAMAAPRMTRLARDGTMATYVQRSAVFGFPDYISVHVVPDAEGSRLSVYSRSRFGHSDLGVNKARVERWLDALQSNIAR